MIPATKKEINAKGKRQRRMQKLQQKALREAEIAARKKVNDDWVLVEPASAINMIKDSIKRKGGRRRKTKRKTKRKLKKDRRKTKRKQKRKRRKTKRR